MEHFLLIIIVLSLVVFTSICLSKPLDPENEKSKDSALQEGNEVLAEEETHVTA